MLPNASWVIPTNLLKYTRLQRCIFVNCEKQKLTFIIAEERKAVPKPSSYTEYVVNIKAPKHLLGQTYREYFPLVNPIASHHSLSSYSNIELTSTGVHIFLGPFDSSLKTWHTQEALVGTFAVFGKTTEPSTAGCGKCRADADRECLVTGTVPLTKQIYDEVKKGDCPSLEKQNVLPYLKDNLHWRVTLADGSEKSRDEVPGLVISVVTTEVNVVGGRERRSGVYEVHPEITTGRPAGLTPGHTEL